MTAQSRGAASCAGLGSGASQLGRINLKLAGVLVGGFHGAGGQWEGSKGRAHLVPGEFRRKQRVALHRPPSPATARHEHAREAALPCWTASPGSSVIQHPQRWVGDRRRGLRQRSQPGRAARAEQLQQAGGRAQESTGRLHSALHILSGPEQPVCHSPPTTVGGHLAHRYLFFPTAHRVFDALVFRALALVSGPPRPLIPRPRQ